MRRLGLVLGLMALAAGCATSGPYVDPSGYDDAADAQRVRDKISDARFKNGRGPALPFQVAQENLAKARQRITEGRDPEAALEYSVEAMAEEGERNITYWHLELEHLEDFRVPAHLLPPQVLNVAISIVRRPPDQQRRRYIVLLATPSLTNYENRQ